MPDTRRNAYDSRNNLTIATDAKTDSTVGMPGTVNAKGIWCGRPMMAQPKLQTIQDLRVGA